MAAAAGRRTLDIPELQMLVEFPGDANGLDFHHRIFWFRVDRSVWIISTPDADVYEEDYDGVTVVPLSRNSLYPQGYAGQMYVPDPVDLMADYPEMKRQAESLAVVRGCQDRPGVVPTADAPDIGGQWRVADVDSKRFGEIIPIGELADGATNVALTADGKQKRLHYKDGEIMTLELVSDFQKWSEAKRPGLPGGDAGDLRILGCVKLASGKRQLALNRALELMSDSKFDDWPHRGPKAVREFLENVVESGGDLNNYHSAFMRKSGLSDNSAAAHEYKNLLSIVRLAISYDQLDCSNLASIEQAVRRILEIQTAVRRNPKHPTFDAFDYNVRGTVDEMGGARAPGYAEWMAEQQRAEAKSLKSTREWRVEQASERRRAQKNDKDSGDDAGPKGKKKKNKSKHSELLPLPRPKWQWRRTRASGVLTGAPDGSREVGRRMAGRLAESVGCVNTLGCTTARSTRRGSFEFEGQQPGGRATQCQTSALSRMAARIRAYGTCPSGLTPKSCFEELIKSKDMYSLSQCAVAPFDMQLLKVTKSETIPKPATQLLPPVEAEYLTDPETHLVRSPEEVSRWAEDNANFQPYWDETLRTSRPDRMALYHRLYEKSLLGFRRRIKSKVGIFFVWKSNKRGIRMIVDARMPNGCHRRPPKTKLGGASSLAALDAFVDEDDLEVGQFGFGGMTEIPARMFGNTGDVSDAFYQFSVESLADWFGLDDPVRASEFGVSSVWDPDLKADVPFAKDNLPAPDLRLGPVGSVYVDNIGIFGLMEGQTEQSFDSAVDALEDGGFVLHELERGSVEVANVGIVLNCEEKTIRHNRRRSWRLYLAIKHVLKLGRVTSEVMRIVAGHIVHYFSIFRPCLSVLHHTYKFIYAWLDGRAHNLPGSVKRELRMTVGLIFQVEIDLAAPYNSVMYCGDSSTYGYCFQSSPASLEELRSLCKFHERWRFVEVEKDFCSGLGSHHSWSADWSVPDLAYTRWLNERLGLPPPGSAELEVGGSCGGSVRRHVRPMVSVDLVGMVPKLPDAVVAPKRWRTIIQRRWKHSEAIHMKEGRVALMTLRREAKRSEAHGKRLLTLSDNLSSLSAFDRGRAKDVALLALCRRAAALQVASGIQWFLRYVESKRNPSDYGSRVFPSDERRRLCVADSSLGQEQQCKRRRDGAAVVAREADPLPGSSMSAQGLRPTAKFGRGDVLRSSGTPAPHADRRDEKRVVVDDESCGQWQAADSEGGLSGPLLAGRSPPSSSRCTVPKPLSELRRSAKVHSSLPVGQSVLELFSGGGSFSMACLTHGLRIGVPFEFKNGVTNAHGRTLKRSGGPAKKQKRDIVKTRAAKAGDAKPGFLRRAKLRKQVTRDVYADAWEQFMNFCVESGRMPSVKSRFVTMHQLDACLESFAEHLFLDGKSKYVITCAIQNANVEYPAWPTSSRLNYPLSKAAKRGWGNLEPGASRDPCPFEVAWLIATDMLKRGLGYFAAAVVICFDTYLRPGKLCDLTLDNIVLPPRGVRSSYHFWTLLLAPQEFGIPTKVGEFNDSLVVGSSGREWVGTLIGRVYAKHSKPGSDRVFPFTLAQLTPEPLAMVFCFSGWAKLSTALDECQRTKGSMPPGVLWLSIGGGNCDAGSGGSVAWSQEILQDFLDNIGKVDLSSYAGIMFDLETNSGGCKAAIAAGQASKCGASSGTDYGTSPSADMFVQAYKAVQALGKGVAVSWSYQMPYCMDNSAEIVNTAIHSDAVKLVSPQMYGGGKFNPNEYAPAVWNGNSKVVYTDYQNVQGQIWPSYTLADGQYDKSANLVTMETMQTDMKNWANAKNIQAFKDSPG
eukprot:s45_g47.t1